MTRTKLGPAVAVLVAALLAATAQTASSSRYLRIGIYDEAQTLYGPIPQTFSIRSAPRLTSTRC